MIWSLPLNSPHPAAHGGPQFRLDVADSVVVSAEVLPGRMHRGVEKLMESRDYRAALVLATRHDWLGAVSSEVGLAELVERQLGLVPPPRALWVRVLLVEYMRMAHHLLWLAQTAAALGLDADAVRNGLDARERMLDGAWELTGARMHLMVSTFGGVRCDPSPEWLRRAVGLLPECVEAGLRLGEVLGDGENGPATGVAVLTRSTAEDYSVSGPVARGSGLAWDLRTRNAGAQWAELVDAGVLVAVTDQGGDAAARFRVLAREVEVSAACVQASAERLTDLPGPVAVRLPKVVRVPAGSGYWAVESPTGVSGWFLVSTGGVTPHRLGMRTASFNNAAAMTATLPGTKLADLPLAVMSHMVVAGDLDA